jgi:outer membrane protein assembly factor BamB
MVFALDPINKQLLWERNLSRSSSLPVISTNTVDPKDGSTQVVYADGFTQHLGNMGPASAVAVILPTQDALVAVDPISGKDLWTRADMPKHCHVYNDDRHVYVIEVGNDGTTAGATHVYRLQDEAPGVTLRLYDILTSQDKWKQQFKAGSRVLETEDPSLGGVVEPDGKVTVVDFGLDRAHAVAPKVLFTAQMKPEHLARVTSLHVLRDQKDVYIACDGQADQQILVGSLMSNIMPYTGIRVMPVNGELYSFDGTNGELNWHNSCANQMILMEEFHSLPMVVLTSRYRRILPGGQQTYVIATRAFDKKTGKLIFNQESTDTNRYQQYHSIRTDSRTGRFELISNNMKVVFQILSNATSMADPPRGRTVGGVGVVDGNTVVPQPQVLPGRVIRGRVVVPQPVPRVLPPAVPPRIIID